MAGGPECKNWRELSGTRMLCIDENGKENGYIEPMTDQQLQMYQYNQQRARQDSAEFNQGLQNLSNSLQRQNEQNNYNFQQFMNRENVYKVRQVGPYGY